jgi:hypothetical protein
VFLLLNPIKVALSKLPGISATDADNIIANRPYGSKAWLVSNKVLNPIVFGTTLLAWRVFGSPH